MESMYIDYMSKWKSTTWATKRLKDMSFLLSDSDGDDELPLNPDRRPYKDDVSA